MSSRHFVPSIAVSPGLCEAANFPSKRAAALILMGCLLSCSRPSGTSEAGAAAIPEAAAGAHRENYIEDANVVELSLAAQQRGNIDVTPVTLGPVSASVLVTGTVKPIESRISQIRPLARGRVLEVLVHIGDRVQANQVLAQFDNIEAGQLAAQYRSAQADLARVKVEQSNAERVAKRARRLVEIGVGPVQDAEIAEANAAGLSEALHAQEAAMDGLLAQLRRFGTGPEAAVAGSVTAIRAPFDGVITDSNAAPGAVVDSTTLLFAVADLKSVYVEAQVYEKDLGKVRIGQQALVRLEAYADETMEGRVAAIRDILDPVTRTASVRIEVPNPDGKLKLEMFGTVELPTLSKHRALSVPAEAVQTIHGRQVIFVRQDPLHFEAREVSALGDGERLEIIAGLQPGEPIVVGGAFQVKSAFLAGELKGEHEH